jgi:hypothetical protein
MNIKPQQGDSGHKKGLHEELDLRTRLAEVEAQA